MKVLFHVIIGFVSSGLLIYAGQKAAQIQSVIGNTVAEAYYNSIGFALIGLGIFVFGISIYIARKVGNDNES